MCFQGQSLSLQADFGGEQVDPRASPFSVGWMTQ